MPNGALCPNIHLTACTLKQTIQNPEVNLELHPIC